MMILTNKLAQNRQVYGFLRNKINAVFQRTTHRRVVLGQNPGSQLCIQRRDIWWKINKNEILIKCSQWRSQIVPYLLRLKYGVLFIHTNPELFLSRVEALPLPQAHGFSRLNYKTKEIIIDYLAILSVNKSRLIKDRSKSLVAKLLELNPNDPVLFANRYRFVNHDCEKTILNHRYEVFNKIAELTVDYRVRRFFYDRLQHNEKEIIVNYLTALSKYHDKEMIKLPRLWALNTLDWDVIQMLNTTEGAAVFEYHNQLKSTLKSQPLELTWLLAMTTDQTLEKPDDPNIELFYRVLEKGHPIDQKHF